MKAVIWADCFQMFIVIGLLISIFIKCSLDVGGAKEVWRIGLEGGRVDFFNDFTWDAAEYATFWNVLFGSIFTWMPAMAIMQYQVQRFMSCKDLRTGYIALSIYAVGMVFMTASCVIGGVFLYSYYADCDPLHAGYIQLSDELVPYFIIDSFHHIPGLSGLFLAGLCSLGLSTVSSVLNALAAVTGTHIVKGLFKVENDTVYVWITKFLVVFFSAVIVGGSFLMQHLGNIAGALAGFVGVINGPIMGVFILGVFFPRANSKGVLVGFFLSLCLGLWLLIGSLIYPSTVEMLPLSIEGCPADPNMTTLIPTVSSVIRTTIGGLTTEAPPTWPPITKFYALSRLWYPTVITSVSIVVGLLASAITGFNNPKDINPDLICHLPEACCFFLPKQWRKWEHEKEYNEPITINADDMEFIQPNNNPGFVEMDEVTT